jgi:hypothetical protein
MAEKEEDPTGTPPEKVEPPKQDPPKEKPADKTAPDFGDDLEKWKHYARTHEAEAAKNRTAAEELAALKLANMSDQEKVAAERDSFKERATKAETALLRAELASEFKLPANMARRLAGSTPEELRVDAKELAEELGTLKEEDPKPGGVQRRPRTKLAAGADPGGDPPDETDPAKLAAKISRG